MGKTTCSEGLIHLCSLYIFYLVPLLQFGDVVRNFDWVQRHTGYDGAHFVSMSRYAAIGTRPLAAEAPISSKTTIASGSSWCRRGPALHRLHSAPQTTRIIYRLCRLSHVLRLWSHRGRGRGRGHMMVETL